MPVISKMKEKIEGRKQKILSLANDYKNSHLLPSSKEITNMDEIDIESIIREREERDREAEESIKNRWKRQFFLIQDTINIFCYYYLLLFVLQ